MSNTSVRGALVAVVAMTTVGLVGGCGSGGGFAKTASLELLDGTIIEAPMSGGAPSLANSEWMFYRRNADGTPGAPLVRVPFGPDGNLISFEDNTLAVDVFGETIILDGERHDTSTDGVSYAAATYGAEGASGLGFQVQVFAYYSSFQVAEGEASLIAEYVDADTLVGTFYFRTEVSDLAANYVGTGANQEDEFEVIALRVG
ncbi:MAG TPA: hypothetical protein PKK06_01825 [Phycisphaerae bacterium]|nr:hypothetical protein [Phycisphaerae bacterium]HNU44137.1 hypothetical protein [Phycisphaerae bacterium]